jgi:hypothetical protein
MNWNNAKNPKNKCVVVRFAGLYDNMCYDKGRIAFIQIQHSTIIYKVLDRLVKEPEVDLGGLRLTPAFLILKNFLKLK